MDVGGLSCDSPRFGSISSCKIMSLFTTTTTTTTIITATTTNTTKWAKNATQWKN